MRVFMTGGTGFVGRKIVGTLKKMMPVCKKYLGCLSTLIPLV